MGSSGNSLLSFVLSLRGRLLVLICLATVPAMLFTVYIAREERNAALQRELDDAQYVLSLLSREHVYQLTGAKQLLKWLASKIESSGGESIASDSKFLSALLAGYPQLGNIAILDGSGNVVSSAYAVSGAVNLYTLDAVQRAIRLDDIVTGIYVVGPIVKRPLLHLAKSIRGNDGRLLYVVFVAIDLEWMKRLADRIEMPPGQVLMIIDRDGRVLSSSGREGARRYPAGKLVPELAMADSKPLSKPVRSAKGDELFVRESIENLPGVLIASSVPFLEASKKANETFLRILASLSLLTLCTAVSVVFLEELALLRYLRALSRASKRFGEGDFSARVSIPRAYGELQSMAEVFNTMAETLTKRHSELIAAHDELERLSRHLQIARESEAERIARDLHDEVGQVLTSIKLDLADFRKQILHSGCSENEQKSIEDNLAASSAKIDELVSFVRQIASELRPPVLDKMGLASAIELLSRNVESKSELVIDLDFENIDELDGLVSITIYRIVQECLTNIVRHAGAAEVSIKLIKRDKEILLAIKDDGCGMDTSEQQKESLGIIGMRERARLVDGSFLLDSRLGAGTTITVVIPQSRGAN